MTDYGLTVFADASHSEDAGGYAYWVRGAAHERIQGSAPWPCKDIQEAETVGICVGIIEALDNFPKVGGWIVAQSDSTQALETLLFAAWKLGENARVVRVAKGTDRPLKIPMRAKPVQESFALKTLMMALDHQVVIYLKHVKGHTGQDDPRSKVNAWCDREAKEARKLCAQQIAAREGRQGEAP